MLFNYLSHNHSNLATTQAARKSEANLRLSKIYFNKSILPFVCFSCPVSNLRKRKLSHFALLANHAENLSL